MIFPPIPVREAIEQLEQERDAIERQIPLEKDPIIRALLGELFQKLAAAIDLHYYTARTNVREPKRA